MAVITLAACGGGTAQEPVKSGVMQMHQPEREPDKSKTAEELWASIADTTNVTLAEYKNIIFNYAYISIDDDFRLKENASDSVISRLSKNKATFPDLGDLVFEMMKNEAPQLRAWALVKTFSLYGMNSKHLNAIKELIANETNLYVIHEAIKALSNEGSDPVVGQYLLDMAKHENAKIRKDAALALGNSWSKSIEGAVDAIITLMNDSDLEVRKTACKWSARLADEKVIDPLVVILNNDADAKLHGDCMNALAALWYDYPSFKNTSEKAYNAFINYLKKTPRTENIPNWTSLSPISTKGSAYEDWKAGTKYFNVKNFCAVCTELIKDNNTNWLLKDAAIKAIALHGTKTDLQALKPIMDKLTCKMADNLRDTYQKELDKI